MTTLSNITIRLAFAYLLIVNSVDMMSSDLSPTAHSTSTNTWLGNLILLAAIINIVGGILLASGWQSKSTALALAASTALFVITYQEPVAMIITGGLLLMAWHTPVTNNVATHNSKQWKFMNKSNNSMPNTDKCCC